MSHVNSKIRSVEFDNCCPVQLRNRRSHKRQIVIETYRRTLGVSCIFIIAWLYKKTNKKKEKKRSMYK